MAKKTRAERKKQNKRVNTSEHEQQEFAEEVVEDEKTNQGNSAVADPKEATDVAVSAEDKAAQERLAKAEAREAKEQQRRIERARKATSKAEKKKDRPERRGPKFFWRIVDYFKSVKVEMKRVSWPSRTEVWKMSVVVVVALVFFGVLIWLVDTAVTPVLVWVSSLGG